VAVSACVSVGKVDGAAVGAADAKVDAGASVAAGSGAAASPPHPVSSKIRTTNKVRFIKQSTLSSTQGFIESSSGSPNPTSA